MPNRHPLPDPVLSPRGPEATPGLPDRGQENAPSAPVTGDGDTRNPNDPKVLDPALLPIGDPAGAA
ncbi:hypothetical protein [Ensifer soli]|uniref:hypothetical protein n=1 Tax=Ciceribacter sp. sgz301302 TaxID=3342379 RepID=UPI0035B71852